MTCFFVRFFKKIYLLILFVIFSLFLVNVSGFTFAMNSNFAISMMRISSEKEIIPVASYFNAIIVFVCISVMFARVYYKGEICDFNKQVNDASHNVYLLVKVFRKVGVRKRCLQLRI